MIGIGDREYVAIRFEAFAAEVLRPAIWPLSAPLEIGVYQSEEPVSLEQARSADYRPVELGLRWGPVWSTAWFRLRGTMPEALAGQPVALRFSSGTEALLWRDGAPRQGFDANRDTCLLWTPAAAGEPVEELIEAACNLPLGATTFFWDHPEIHARWQEERPGRLEAAALVAVDLKLERVLEKYELARRALLALPADSARAVELLAGLRAITDRIPPADPREAALAAEEELDALLRGAQAPAATTCVAVGHSHVDTAWLWRVRETRRKLLRSWASTLELMERFPQLHFVASHAQHYAFVEEDSPALFERIRARVEEGRWEAGGAMWVEPDCNCPSGESLVRQILHGVGYWRERFGERGAQRFLFLPDTFGFPASLPQIMRLAGLDTFITNKLSWCERNAFPHVTFLWRGIDGSEVLSHMTPGDDINAPLGPEVLHHGEQKLLERDHGAVGGARGGLRRWLQPFGFGDGGGGPTAAQALCAEQGTVAGLPRVEQGRVDDFCGALHAERAERLAAGERDLPVWDGELYLELHRGTLTTHAWLKRKNARAERRLRALEILLASLADESLAERLAPDLDRLWKAVLLHQFHDILPGTSIAEVYAEARMVYTEIDAWIDGTLGYAARVRMEELGGGTQGLFNPASRPLGGVVDQGGEPVFVAPLPPLGIAPLATSTPSAPVRVEGHELSNAHLSLRLDEVGRIAELRRASDAEPLNARDDAGELLPLNQLVAYDDRPRRWEAWDIDFDCADRATPLDAPAASITVLEAGPLRAAIEVVHEFRASRITQRYRLSADCPWVEVDSEVDWNEERTLLRALCPTAIRARHATYGVQFGHLERSTHKNTSWDEARFEVPGQGWMDLAQPGLGLAVLDDGKYGRSAEGGSLGLTLLRAPTFPDAGADRGAHAFRYALMPHGGDRLAAGVAAAAEAFASPLMVLSVPSAGGQGELEGEIAAFKRAEDGRGRILRLVERSGGRTAVELTWRLPHGGVVPNDLLEEPTERPFERADATSTALTLRPFEILTLRLLPPEPRPA